MNLVFFGTSEFAVPALKALAPHVRIVVSQPDRPSGRGLKLKSSPVKETAVALSIPVVTPEKARAQDFVAFLRGENQAAHTDWSPVGAAKLDSPPDALVVAAYGQILSQAVLESAHRGGINLHGSILPRYRGAAPIQRAILEGETTTGVTLMQMDKGMDTGDIIAIESTSIGPEETYGELQHRLAVIAASLASEWMPRIVTGSYPRVPQDDGESSMAPKVRREETELNPSRGAVGEFRRFRAFTPVPGTFLDTLWGVLKVHGMKLRPGRGEPGVVLNLRPLCIACVDGVLELVEVQPAAKPRMTGTDWANGQRLKVGDRVIGTSPE